MSNSTKKRCGKVHCYTKEFLQQLLQGTWVNEPSDDWYAETVTISRGQAKMEAGKKVLFIAIDSDTWHRGSGNQGIYSGWTDTHNTVHRFSNLIHGVIVQRPIKDLDPSIPQLVVENSYEAILKLSEAVRVQFNGKVIGITGTAGKSTTKSLLAHVLKQDSEVIATRGNHNTRTGVPLTAACAIHNPDFLILETAMSALWMRSGGVMKKLRPHFAIITSIDGGQKKTPHETALHKAKICEGMSTGGTVLLNAKMNEFSTVLHAVKEQGEFNIVTYGDEPNDDSYIIEAIEQQAATFVRAVILGEEIEYTVPFLGEGMISNTIAVLTLIKLLGKDIQKINDRLLNYRGNPSVLEFETLNSPKGTFTLLDDSWNATGVAMIQAIQIFTRQSAYFKGKKIAILGRIENLGEDAKRQHELLVQPILDSSIDLVFAHGPEMKYVLHHLPKEMIGGYFEDEKELAKRVANCIEEDSFILLKGSPRSSNFKWVKRELLQAIQQTPRVQRGIENPHATGYGAMTIDFQSGDLVGMVGDPKATQNQGIGNILLLNEVLDLLFSKKVKATESFKPGKQELRENRSVNALPLKENEPVTVYELLTASIVANAPNALLMLANQVIGGNRLAMQQIRASGERLNLSQKHFKNITGRRVSSGNQALNLSVLAKAASLLFSKYPKELGFLSSTQFVYKGAEYTTRSNLLHYGYANYALMYGQNDSIGIALTKDTNRSLITVVLGATDAFHRDQLFIESIEKARNNSRFIEPFEPVKKRKEKEYVISILGDTYFGEFYTDIRRRRGREDALLNHDRNYSFDRIRKLLHASDFTIANFEAALTTTKQSYLKKSKPFVLYAEPEKTTKAIQKEPIDLLTLANNHLMDYGVKGLQLTLDRFKHTQLPTIGAGFNEEEAVRPYVQEINGMRFVVFNAYWYRHPMYRLYDFYAIGSQPGVACLSGRLLEDIQQERKAHPNAFILVISHWGVDFETVRPKQKQYAKSLIQAGADAIIGHGAHMMQEIEYIDHKPVVYSIGNGVFNSDGEYNKRFVAPYSAIAQLIIRNKLHMQLRIYPIYSDNLATFWQPEFVNMKQMTHCAEILQSYNGRCFSYKQDQEGRYYFELPLHHSNEIEL